MRARFVLAPEAAQDLAVIWRYMKEKSGAAMADRMESAIRERFVFLSKNPDAGHWRKDLTSEPVKFFPVYSYLIVYRPKTRPEEVVCILHGHRDVENVLAKRL